MGGKDIDVCDATVREDDPDEGSDGGGEGLEVAVGLDWVGVVGRSALSGVIILSILTKVWEGL